MAKRPRTLADKIRDLDEPTPKDFDPEEDHDSASGSEDGGSDSDDGAEDTKGSEHYIDVGKSKLRKSEELPLGRKYAGAQISRAILQQDEEESEGNSAEDEEDDPFAARRDVVADSQDSQDTQESGDGDEDVDMSSDNGEDEKSIDEGEASEPVTDELIKAENGVPREGVNKATEERVEEDEDEDEDEDGDEDDEDDEDDDEDNDLSSNSDSDTDPSDISDAESSTTDQQTLRKMMGESQKSVLASISQATKADAAKGRAVKQQRQTFDALLNTRIRLQKALVAANSLSVATPSAKPSSPSPSLVSEPDDAPSFQGAEEAAFNLWQSLHNLRTSLISSSPPATLKRKRSFTSTTPLSNLWTETQALTTASLLTHRAILDKWARKTRTTTTLPSTSRRLNNTSTDQPLTSIIDSHLSTATLPRLLLKTTVPRSCAPIQAASAHPSTTSTTTNTTDPTTVPLLNPSQVYDDSDLYQSLLTTLVAQRTANLSLANSTATTLLPSTALGLPKLPKQHRLTRTADKKASKGRRVRYDVHEKLQNFMAAEVTGPGWWEESRVGEFFTGLVGGVKRGLREEEEGGEERDNDDEEESDGDGDGEDSESRRGMSGLRLFG